MGGVSDEVGHSPAYARSLMADDGLGPWKPLELGDVVHVFRKVASTLVDQWWSRS